MKRLLAIFIAASMLFTACGGANKPAEADRNFYYKDTKWGMTLDEVVKAAGTPDLRTDEAEAADDGEGYFSVDFDETSPDALSNEADGENPDAKQYIDFYYYEQPIFDGKYTVEEKYLFDESQTLWGVIDAVDIGEVSKDLMNRDDVAARGKEAYMDIREILTEKFGPPAAEYTAYQEAGEYKTEELLDLEKENALICASRWDGDDYRFIYIIYFLNGLMLDVRYIPHDKETVDAAKEAEASQ